jgi:hypothetical protein
MRASALASIEQKSATAAGQVRELTAANLAVIAAMEPVFDLMQRYLGRLQLRDSRLMFPDSASLNQYRVLIQDVRSAAARETAVFDGIRRARTQQIRDAQEELQRVTEH